MNSVIFTDGSSFFKQLGRNYIKHDKGLFIMTPSGAGKTYFCRNQEQPNWIDGDDLWIESGAQPPPETKWWDLGLDTINRIEQRCDVITAQAVDKGYWVLGSVNYWLQPDALVIPEWEVLVSQIKQRQYSGEYDGGMTDKHHEQVKSHIRWLLEEWNAKQKVPVYKSIKEAVEALTN